jgi:hypothetical protein
MTSCQVLLRMRNISDINLTENRKTLFIQKPFPGNRTIYEIMRKNMVDPDRTQMTNNTTLEKCDFHTGLLRQE